ncbi:MAG: hypothetical protein A2487_15235 [Candidatus Raymondbacteria bacterium RifOxyC12_full_50_8]|uniref:FlgD/Vpr Ig-like domain-containing protein n=1 Tax=Candidatus Raymondbacteria bacterium RIFOXYD12_FULL_49_13 TaxID=1817890 RepID=A0A1F7FJT0_UNCRA|nr:MAG: hypothetical protein A2350_10630 [Candidatus Raymondbacteria bacterium RifOxyB12_full_50_8]OGJ91991.1 MAG: hypothetical protein A2248_09455 [Candidatus Raymondbacteria bacterium RIFOXYA2_FULL_49_16]OGJ96341.1 MAG: hypothetical protein A2453_08435 [Candidatus Raymondbacteria bacterium RIFOXYC2_FULL_50_21]OGK03724.1 MAG: hypothetical protein A2487_15235 [Candidatus Raymondbacteria bacterium RifOxyC12_full_50_8]OGK06878.1 MAG: hypothetical protein A2519_11505 [Candidatus Raymondbacteria ba
MVSSIFLSAYTTWDGKIVPPLPGSASPSLCSTNTQLYMALRTQTANRIIVLKDGTYNIASFEPLRIDSSGITIRGESGDPTKVVIRGSGFRNCTNLDEEMFVLYNGNVTFADLTITDSRCHGLKVENARADNVLLHNVRFISIGERKIKGGSVYDPTNWEIRYCHFEDTLAPINDACRQDHDNGNYIAGMDLMNARDWIVHDCVFRNIRGATGGGRGAIFFWQGCQNMTVERNTFMGCDRNICFGNSSGGTAVTGGFIRNNFIVRGADNGIEMEHSSLVRIYNNTLYSTNPTYTMTVQFSANGADNEFRNNIIFGNISGSVQTMSNNITKNSAADANTNWFVDRTNGDLHLTANATQATNTGADLVSDDWDGHLREGTPDIGADEYNSVRVEGAYQRSVSPMVSISSVEPNPFNPSVTIQYCISSLVCEGTENALLAVYTMSGRQVKVMFYGNVSAGMHEIQWDGKDGSGTRVAGGIYVFCLKMGERTAISKGLLIR